MGRGLRRANQERCRSKPVLRELAEPKSDNETAYLKALEIYKDLYNSIPKDGLQVYGAIVSIAMLIKNGGKK